MKAIAGVGLAPQPRWAWQRLAFAHPYLWSILIVVVITVSTFALQRFVPIPNTTALYLIGVLLSATSVGRWPAVLCAVLSFLAYKLFFVPPLFTLNVDSVDDVVRLSTFLAIALAGGGLAIRLWEQASAAQRRAGETAALYELSQTISTELDFEDIAPLVAETSMRLLECSACTLMVHALDGEQRETARAGIVSADARIVAAPLRSRDRVLGSLQVYLPAESESLDANGQQLLETLASQAALALERSRLAVAAAHAEALAESDRLKSTLLSAISHDFRTPLASITAAADELSAEDVQWSDEARREFSQVIRNEAERLNRLLINLLDLTRLETGVLKPQRGWYNIAEIIGVVVPRFTAELVEHPVDLTVPDDLPLVPVDYVHVEQVLWNVLQNAVKYSPAGSPIGISAAVEGSAVVVRVSDCGPGVPPEERERVFEKFYRLQPPEQGKVPGVGVGLAICKGLVEANGGSIGINGRPGGGTEVWIRLPLDVPGLQA